MAKGCFQDGVETGRYGTYHALLKTTLKRSGQAHLYGMTNFGDSVEDEWLIVYILRELTNHFPNSWVKVVDNGGEFLLIQAANALPRWLTPEVADNRVSRSSLHLVMQLTNIS